jgi:hypothetical protein
MHALLKTNLHRLRVTELLKCSVSTRVAMVARLDRGGCPVFCPGSRLELGRTGIMQQEMGD